MVIGGIRGVGLGVWGSRVFQGKRPHEQCTTTHQRPQALNLGLGVYTLWCQVENPGPSTPSTRPFHGTTRGHHPGEVGNEPRNLDFNIFRDPCLVGFRVFRVLRVLRVFRVLRV